MAEHGGHGPGFDTLRISLAILIITFHSFGVSYGIEYATVIWNHPIAALPFVLLPMFFALSGFLVMGSAVRVRRLGKFVALRGLRIMPALAAEIVLSALVLGVAFTALPLADYFLNREFLNYFGSLYGRVRMSLPGVFLDNPHPDIVNVALWTIPPELLCYVFLAVLMLLGVFEKRLVVTAVVAVLSILSLANNLVNGNSLLGRAPPPDLMVLAFACGNLLFLWRDRVPIKPSLFAAAAATAFMTDRNMLTVYLAIPCIAYCTVYLGFHRLPNLPLFRRGDYSYGVYLYGYPLQQTVAHLLPDHRHWYVNVALAVPSAVLMAMLSWRLVEKPALELRQRLTFAGELDVANRPIAGYIALVALLGYAFFLAVQSLILPWGPGRYLMTAVAAATILVMSAVIIAARAGAAAAVAR